ncbi:hypothetical protein [Scytonema millei]|uniref:Uncharacterized protein n=1 Tax=Scytonema millei VB511283 TaxID=1245923 RepID=A0A9X5E0J1_9CYAN|nr:hypothetical protein [Scytonema millei]NHC33069.1 hypothetical protein [Scytonema millei VB511283]
MLVFDRDRGSSNLRRVGEMYRRLHISIFAVWQAIAIFLLKEQNRVRCITHPTLTTR